jgi:GT2 family glycosyltransferase
MVTTAKSGKFTPGAISSFLTTTKLTTADLFILIDNDDSWADTVPANIQIIKNTEPRSFAYNINQLLKIADKLGLDLIMMNNDIVLTPDWLTGLERRNDIICLPSCNQTHSYAGADGEIVFDQNVELEEYSGRQPHLYRIAAHHKNNFDGYFEKLHTSFYLFRLPREVYTKVGLFDETFTPAGGEDVDYRIRAALAGFDTMFTTECYVLHFHGKSTWAGSETATETDLRNTSYLQRFIEKWGEDLAYLLLKAGQSVDKISHVVQKYNANDAIFINLINKVLNSNIINTRSSTIPFEEVSAPGLLPYIEALGDNLIGCELGVCKAATLVYFLDLSDKISKVYAVDAWQPYMDHWGQVTQQLVDQWKNVAVETLAPHGNRVDIIQADSFVAADRIPSRSLDFIFIDGDHCYAAVARDLRRYWGKVKPGGIFAGHDWTLPPVRAAVEHFRAERGIDAVIQFTDKDVWFWYK